MDYYLNVGYSLPGQKHLQTNTHLRLIDHIAGELLALHMAGPHATDHRLLDVASGRGGPAIYAHEKYGFEAVGIDVSRYNVQCADRNARKRRVSSAVKFIMGNTLALPVADASFPVAWSIESPAHFPNKPAFLREVRRALKASGVFAFADLLVVDEVVVSSDNRSIYERFLQVWDVPYLESRDGYEQAIADAGFELHRTQVVTEYNLNILRRYCCIFLQLLRFLPVYHAYKRYIRWRTGADLDNVYEQVLRSYQALRLGMIDYGLFWAVRQ
jgi:ubiquinone/menaquinone biosynthesis C-methylase UbiE